MSNITKCNISDFCELESARETPHVQVRQSLRKIARRFQKSMKSKKVITGPKNQQNTRIWADRFGSPMHSTSSSAGLTDLPAPLSNNGSTATEAVTTKVSKSSSESSGSQNTIDKGVVADQSKKLFIGEKIQDRKFTPLLKNNDEKRTPSSSTPIENSKSSSIESMVDQYVDKELESPKETVRSEENGKFEFKLMHSVEYEVRKVDPGNDGKEQRLHIMRYIIQNACRKPMI